MSRTNLASATAHFSFKLFGELLAREPTKNVFISPASVYLALAMALNGAAGKTRSEIAELLGVAGFDLDEINRACAELIQGLSQREDGTLLAIANSLWARQGIPFEEDFLERNRTIFTAATETLDFADPAAVQRINAWVCERTHGKIDTIVDQIPPDAIMYLINAIYFKGRWGQAFAQEDTRDRPFQLAGGGQKQVPMMRQERMFAYHEAPDYQALLLAYDDHQLSMLVMLPHSGLDMAMLQRLLSDYGTSRWEMMFQLREGTLMLPRLTLEYEAQLSAPLIALGLRLPFDPDHADFSALTPLPNVVIDEVKHKTFLEVNEQGTEAAAITSVRLVVLGAFDDDDTFHMIVDRPFFCAILDDKSRTIVFLGAIVEP